MPRDGSTSFTSQTTRPTEIATATTIVQWYEPSLKMVVGLTAFDLAEETLDRFIESLRVASPQEIEGLLDRYPEEPPWLDGGDVAGGNESGRGASIAVAEGEETGQRWQLLIYEQDDGYVEIDLNWADAMSGLATGQMLPEWPQMIPVDELG